MSEIKTTAEALRWAISVIETFNIGSKTSNVDIELDADGIEKFARAKEILALSEFVESDVAPDYSKDGGFDTLTDTTPAAYAMPENK